MVNLFNMTSLVIVVFSLNALAAFNKTTACKDMDFTIWQKNWAGCARGLKNAIDAKAVDANWMNIMCDCAADELINKISCEDLKRYEKDEKFAKELNDKVTATCAKKVPLKKPGQ